MKKKTVLAVLLACAVASGAILPVLSGRRPFRDLQPSDVVAASVRLTPPDKTVPITEFPELVSYLKEVVIYRKDSSYRDYSGQGVTFSLTMADGTRTAVMAYNPFIVIDGVGYRTKYEPCEKLNRYANRLLREETESR